MKLECMIMIFVSMTFVSEYEGGILNLLDIGYVDIVSIDPEESEKKFSEEYASFPTPTSWRHGRVFPYEKQCKDTFEALNAGIQPPFGTTSEHLFKSATCNTKHNTEKITFQHPSNKPANQKALLMECDCDIPNFDMQDTNNRFWLASIDAKTFYLIDRKLSKYGDYKWYVAGYFETK